MQLLIKTCALSLMFAGLTACGGGGGGGDSKPQTSTPKSSAAPSSTPASSTPASSTPATSTPASSLAASSVALSSSSASSTTEGSETTQTATSFNGYSIAKIDNCGVGISAANKTFAIFADYDGGIQNQSLSSLSFSGWNHSTNENAGRPEWKLLANTGATYNFSTSAKVNESCNGADTINMVFAKKIADWEMQHMNGFERNILSYGYKFGDITSLVVDLKLNSSKTKIPSLTTLKATYSSYVNETEIEKLDEGKANIDITFHDGGNLWGKINIQLDQDNLKDQWVRVTVPVDKINFYEQIGYNTPTPKTPAQMSNVVIKRMLVVGEVKNGSVLRGPIGETKWNNGVPETLKETDLSFKKIEFQLK